MIAQHWLVRNGSTLFCVSTWPCDKKPLVGVVLFSGFSQPICDIDYYMSKLSKELVAHGMYTLQVDMRGHGDSSGLLCDVTLSSMKEDIICAIDSVKEIFGNNVICIGRGLSATILAEIANEKNFLGVCGVAPYALDPARTQNMWKDIGEKCYEIQDIYGGSDYIAQSDFDSEKTMFFNSLGGDSINLHGQKINGKMLIELCEYDSYPILSQCRNRLWLIPSEENKNQIKQHVFDEQNKYLPDKNNKYMLPRIPLWHYHSYQCITSWINEK